MRRNIPTRSGIFQIGGGIFLCLTITLSFLAKEYFLWREEYSYLSGNITGNIRNIPQPGYTVWSEKYSSLFYPPGTCASPVPIALSNFQVAACKTAAVKTREVTAQTRCPRSETVPPRRSEMRRPGLQKWIPQTQIKLETTH